MGKKIIPFADGILVKEVSTRSIIKLPDQQYANKAWEIIAIGSKLKDFDYKIGDHLYMKPGSQFSTMGMDNIRKISEGAIDANIAVVEERHIAFAVRSDSSALK